MDSLLTLTTLVVLPLVGALLVALTPKAATQLQRLITLLTTVVVGVIGVLLYLDFDGTSAAAQFTQTTPWFTLPGGIAVHWRLGLDGLSVLMVGPTAVLGPIVVLDRKSVV